MPKLRAIENITSFKPILETNNQQVRDETIKLIEKTVLTFLRKLDSATKTTDVRKNKRQNSYLRNSFEIQSPASSSSERLLFSVGSLPTFSRQFRAMAQIYSLLLGNRRSTKRDLYYEYKKVYKNKQRNLDSAVSKICRFFHRPRQCLNVVRFLNIFRLDFLYLRGKLLLFITCRKHDIFFLISDIYKSRICHGKTGFVV
uniref:TP6A_N domain-containing protein n=1 Tax=Bursaphelenchus xylophilus TaxID=6326 RepID=A0A1I7RPC3_BURXY